MTQALPTSRRPLTFPTGFTLLEVLAVVAIIAVLITFTVIGVRQLGGATGATATRAILQTMESMLAELERANNGSLPKDTINQWAWMKAVPSGGGQPDQEINTSLGVIDRLGSANGNTPPTGAPAEHATIQLNFWFAPNRYDSNNSNSVTASDQPAPIIAPGVVRKEDVGSAAVAAERFGSPAVINTAIAIASMASVSANRSILDAYAADRLDLPLWQSSADYPRAARVSLKPSGSQLFHFIAARANSAGQSPNSAGSANTNWEVASRPTPLVLDAWGNPILFVPASGLLVGELYQSTKAYKAGDRVYTVSSNARTYWLCLQDQTTPSSPNSPVWATSDVSADTDPANDFPTRVVSPSGRPFFASAGPDGDFGTHNDNIYSFE